MSPKKAVAGIAKDVFPFLRWVPELRDGTVVRADLIAGLTVAMVIIPQSMAYAQLAGLPPVYGLYAAFLPPAVAALFGSSRQLATGPVAMASLISAATIQRLAPAGLDAYVTLSILLALMVGAIRLSLGIARLGVLVNLLSAPVVVGFTNAGALIIATSQLHHILGVTAQKGDYHFQTVWHVLRAAMEQTHLPSVAMAGLAAVLLFGIRRFLPRVPHVLVAAALTSVVAWLAPYGGRIVGVVPRGIPDLMLPEVDLQAIPKLATGAVTLTLIGLMEAMAIAKTIATRTRQRIDINQELIGQGMANLIGSLFQSYAVSGSFSRSAVNYASGARTGFSSVVTSLVVMTTLLWLTPLLHYLPQATLAVIIVVAVANLIRVEPLIRAWRVNHKDGIIGAATFAVTLGLAPDLHWGIILGVSMSLIVHMYRTMRPRVSLLSRHPDGTLRGAREFGLELDPQIAIVRFDGGLYFGAGSYFEDEILKTVAQFPQLRYLIVDASGINRIDATGEMILRSVIDRLEDIGVELLISRAKKQLVDGLIRAEGDSESATKDHRFFRWNQHALEFAWAQLGPEHKARSPLNAAYAREKCHKNDDWHTS